MSLKTILIIVAVLIVIVPDVFFLIMRKKMGDELFNYVKEGNTAKFYEVIDSKLACYVFQPYNREYYKLSVALGEKNNKKVEEQIETMNKMGMNKQQKMSYYNQIFSYYIAQKNDTKVQEVINKIKELKDDALTHQVEMVYDIEIKNGYAYLDEMLQREIETSGQEKLSVLVMIERMYQNKNDKEKEQEYKQKIDEMLNQNKKQ